MRTRHGLTGMIGLLALVLLPLGAARADGIAGYWLTPSKHGNAAVVHIYPEGGVFNGKIAALRLPRYPADADNGLAGKPRLDLRNPEKSLRHRPVVGLEIVHGFEPDGEGKWDGATIYDPNSGKTYKCTATLADGGRTLKIRGYVGIPLFGDTQEWKRVAGPDIFNKPE